MNRYKLHISSNKIYVCNAHNHLDYLQLWHPNVVGHVYYYFSIATQCEKEVASATRYSLLYDYRICITLQQLCNSKTGGIDFVLKALQNANYNSTLTTEPLIKEGVVWVFSRSKLLTKINFSFNMIVNLNLSFAEWTSILQMYKKEEELFTFGELFVIPGN